MHVVACSCHGNTMSIWYFRNKEFSFSILLKLKRRNLGKSKLFSKCREGGKDRRIEILFSCYIYFSFNKLCPPFISDSKVLTKCLWKCIDHSIFCKQQISYNQTWRAWLTDFQSRKENLFQNVETEDSYEKQNSHYACEV